MYSSSPDKSCSAIPPGKEDYDNSNTTDKKSNLHTFTVALYCAVQLFDERLGTSPGSLLPSLYPGSHYSLSEISTRMIKTKV